MIINASGGNISESLTSAMLPMLATATIAEEISYDYVPKYRSFIVMFVVLIVTALLLIPKYNYNTKSLTISAGILLSIILAFMSRRYIENTTAKVALLILIVILLVAFAFFWYEGSIGIISTYTPHESDNTMHPCMWKKILYGILGALFMAVGILLLTLHFVSKDSSTVGNIILSMLLIVPIIIYITVIVAIYPNFHTTIIGGLLLITIVIFSLVFQQKIKEALSNQTVIVTISVLLICIAVILFALLIYQIIYHRTHCQKIGIPNAGLNDNGKGEKKEDQGEGGL